MAKQKKAIGEGELRLEASIPAPPEAVYDAWLDAETHAAFTGAAATSEKRVGGAFSAWDGYISGEHRELVDGKLIVQSWTTTEFPPGHPPSTVTVTLAREGKGTHLVLEQTGLPPEQTERYAQGWVEFYFEPLSKWAKALGGKKTAKKALGGKKKAPAKKPAPAKKAGAKKATAKNAGAKKATAKKAPAKKATAQKRPAAKKRATSRKR